jgi:hypothetical protein
MLPSLVNFRSHQRLTVLTFRRALAFGPSFELSPVFSCPCALFFSMIFSNSFAINPFRTLFVTRGGTPPLAFPDCSQTNPATFVPALRLGKFFRCNTCGQLRKCCKQRTYGISKSFRYNTYKKTGGASHRSPRCSKPHLSTGHFLPRLPLSLPDATIWCSHDPR